MGEKLSTKAYWENFWENAETDKNFIPHYHKLAEQFFPHNENWTCFEVGCVPGNYLLYFHKKFGYKPAGIDYTDKITQMKKNFKKMRVPLELYDKDFFNFSPNKKYDVVISNGFVEHFKNPEIVFKKHYDLLADKGLLFINMPNFTNFQYAFHKLFDSKMLEGHNFDVMKPEIWRKLAEKHKLKIHYCDYYETFTLWIGNKSLLLAPARLIAAVLVRIVRRVLRTAKLDNIPNKYFSSSIVLIAEKN